MAIFGELSDMPLADALALMGKGFCKVTLTKLPSQHQYELLFQDKCLFCILIDNKAVEDVFGVSVAMSYLVQARQGEFRMDRKLDAQLSTSFSYIIPLEQLLLSSMAANTEIEQLKHHFPSEMTVFIFSGKHDCWMEDELQVFCDLAGPLLERGANGADIAALTGLEQDRVLLNLYKLRSASLIAPHRAPVPTVSKLGAVVANAKAASSKAATATPLKRAIFSDKKANPPSDKIPRIFFTETQQLSKDRPASTPPAALSKPVISSVAPKTGSVHKPAAAAPLNPAVSATVPAARPAAGTSVPAVPPVSPNKTLMPAPPVSGLTAPPVPALASSSGSTAPRTPSAPPSSRTATTVTRQAPGVPAPVADLRNVRIQRPKVGFFSRILEKLSSSLVKG